MSGLLFALACVWLTLLGPSEKAHYMQRCTRKRYYLIVDVINAYRALLPRLPRFLGCFVLYSKLQHSTKRSWIGVSLFCFFGTGGLHLPVHGADDFIHATISVVMS